MTDFQIVVIIAVCLLCGGAAGYVIGIFRGVKVAQQQIMRNQQAMSKGYNR